MKIYVAKYFDIKTKYVQIVFPIAGFSGAIFISIGVELS